MSGDVLSLSAADIIALYKSREISPVEVHNRGARVCSSGRALRGAPSNKASSEDEPEARSRDSPEWLYGGWSGVLPRAALFGQPL
jgi:hypothetical protein